MRRLFPLMWREWQHHPWRHAAAVVAVALGVALAWSVHLINSSALNEFSAAVRSANGQPDAVLRGPRDGFDEGLLDRLASHPDVQWASPVLEIDTYARSASSGRRVPVKLLGVDALSVAVMAPDLLARPHAGSSARLAALDPQRVFANAAAREKLGLVGTEATALELQSGPQWLPRTWSGDIAAGGGPLLVMDVAAVQADFDMAGRLSRIDLQFAPGGNAQSLSGFIQEVQKTYPGIALVPADEAEQRVSNLSRAYRVNLTVLALVALFVGSFLVYAVMALSVAQRMPQLALLGVLGLSAAHRLRMVLVEAAILGGIGSLIGLLLGSAMALAALHWLAGDLGGGYFPTSSRAAPKLNLQAGAVVLFGLLGVAAAMIGAWVPARQAQSIQPAQALKGLGRLDAQERAPWWPLALCAVGTALAFLPPVAELPLAAYASVAAWLFGGVALVPWFVAALLQRWPRPAGALPLLALERAQFHRHTATAAVAGVVASLALSVALTVMVASFREGVSRWLDSVLPADLYVRTAQSGSLAEHAWLPPEFVQQVASLPGVRRVQPARSLAMQLSPGRPAITLFARELDTPETDLPMVERPLAPSASETGVYVSEAMVALYGAHPGTLLTLPLAQPVKVRVLGVWRDYARQFGTVAMDTRSYQALTGDTRVNDLAIWLQPGADMAAVQSGLRKAAPDPDMLDFASAADLRRLSLAIFDRSFAVTSYLQVVAIGIGLLGIAASLSAQVMVRRKEFGLLAHLGITRRQVIALVVGESAAWLGAGLVLGLLLGAVISAVLVHVVNPQSFHWTMDIVWPWERLALLAGGVFVAGLLTAALSGRKAAGHAAVLAVKEDW